MSQTSVATPESPNKSGFVSNLISRCLGVQIQAPGGVLQKIQAIAVGLLAISITFFVGHKSNAMYDSLFPDPGQERAEALQRTIADKISNIETLSRIVTDQLSGSGRDIGPELRAGTDRLVAAIEELRPTLRDVGNFGGSAALLYANAKQGELDRQNFSTASDFVIPSGQGATVCPDRYIFGFRSGSGTSITGSLSGNASHVASALEPGDSLILKNSDGNAVQVGYQGKFGEGQDARYGFSIICPK